MTDSVIVDRQGQPMQKADCSAEGSWRGPFSAVSGYGDPGNRWVLGSLDMGFQRNLEPQSYRACAAAFAAINVCAQTVATLEPYHQRVLANSGREIITTSALSRILRNPNSYQTGSDFFLNLVFSLLSFGNAYALASRNDRSEVESLHLMPARETAPYLDPDDQSVYYGLGNNPLLGDLSMLVPARDVWHVRMHTPRHPLIGASPINHAVTAIAVNTAIGGNQAAFFNNMSRPSGVLTTDEKLTREQMGALREAWQERSHGMRAGDVPILTWGLKWQPMTITSEDAQLIDAYRLSIEDIARVFRVPLMLIGDYTKSTYNNAEQLIGSWLATGLGFLLGHIEKSLAKFFRLPATELVDFDVSALLRADLQARIDALTKGISGGLFSPDEARAREGLPAVEGGWGAMPRVQAQVVPLSQVAMSEPAVVPDVLAVTEPTAPPRDAATPSEEAQKILALYELKRLVTA